MKLAFCLFNYFPYGGLQRDFLRFASFCSKKGHEIHVFTMKWDGEVPEGIDLHLIGIMGAANHTRCRRFSVKLRRALDKYAFDLVIGFNKLPYLDVYYAADVCYQDRVKKEKSLLYRLSSRYRTYLGLEQAVFDPGSDTEIILISPLEQAKYASCYLTPPSRFHQLPPAIHKKFEPIALSPSLRQSIRNEYHVRDQDYLLLMVGSGFHTKGVDRAIRGLATLPADLKDKTTLLIIGRGEKSPFIKLARRLEVDHRLHFLGPHDEIQTFLWAADLLVHPAYHENTGTIILEALVAGLPVLTNDVCGYAQYINEANAGVVLPSPYSQEKFNESLIEMLSKVNTSSWQTNALNYARNAPIYENTDTFLKILEVIHVKSKNKCDDSEIIFLDKGLRKQFPLTKSLFQQMMLLKGKRFRQHKNRLTQRVQINGNDYVIKQHFGIGYREIFKNLFQLKTPVLSAKNEWLAISKLQSLGINTPNVYGFGEKGKNPSKRQSFLLMEEVTNYISLEDLGKSWRSSPPTILFKRKLIAEVAHIARTLHKNGINHRDFYICHFLLDLKFLNSESRPKIYLLDLHRAQIRQKVPVRWIIKDLAALYFSSKEIGLTKNDLLYFLKEYRKEISLRKIIATENNLWKKVLFRGNKLYQTLKA